MSSDCFAVRVKNVSKIYRLWGSPRNRLRVSLKRLLSHVLPAKWLNIKENESLDFPEFYALKDILLDIRKGESWGFIGVNGSGKSTLLKIISGNLRPSRGSVEVDGKVVILDYGSGFNGEFTGKENIYLKAILLGLSRKQINERYQSIVDFAEIDEFIDQPVKTYSSGMLSRLGFAIIAHVDADIIITDEALAVGDVFFVQKCMKFIREFLKKGTFLFVSHSTNDVVSLCEHAVWLERGVVKSIGPASKVTQAYLDKSHVDKIKSLTAEDEAEASLADDEIIKSEVVLGQPKLSKLMNAKQPKPLIDAHRDANNLHYLRNDIEIPRIDFTSVGIDTGGAKITSVALEDEEGTALGWIIGGEAVTLSIEVLAERELRSPIVGFQVMDRLGQILFADNTYLMTLEQPVIVKQGTKFTAEFHYQMPLLPVGDYVVRAAIAIGEEDSAVLLQTLNNALAFRSVTSGVRHGLVGIPMHSIKFTCQSVENHA